MHDTTSAIWLGGRRFSQRLASRREVRACHSPPPASPAGARLVRCSLQGANDAIEKTEMLFMLRRDWPGAFRRSVRDDKGNVKRTYVSIPANRSTCRNAIAPFSPIVWASMFALSLPTKRVGRARPSSRSTRKRSNRSSSHRKRPSCRSNLPRRRIRRRSIDFLGSGATSERFYRRTLRRLVDVVQRERVRRVGDVELRQRRNRRDHRRDFPSIAAQRVFDARTT